MSVTTKIRALVLMIAVVLVAGCGSGHSGGGAVSPPASGTGTSTHAAGQPIPPRQQLQSTIQLQSDLDALTAPTTATEGDLLNAVATLQQHYQAVAGSHAGSDDADWQQALNQLQQALAAVQQLANANSSTPDAPNPLHQGSSTTSASPQTPPTPPTPPPTGNPVVDRINDAVHGLQKVTNALSFTVKVINPGTGTVTDFDTLSNPVISCGPAHTRCQGVVFFTDTLHLVFQPLLGRTVGNIQSDPNGTCNPTYVTGNTRADCNVSATPGVTVTITPQWG